MKLKLLSLFAILILLCSCQSNIKENEGEIFIPAEIQPRVEKIFYTSDLVYALNEDETLWCWGTEFDYEKGFESTDIITPKKFELLDVSGKVKDIKSVGNSTFMLLNNGDLYSWGSNSIGGVLGDGTEFLGKDRENGRNTPKKIMENVKKIEILRQGLMSDEAENLQKTYDYDYKTDAFDSDKAVKYNMYNSSGTVMALNENGELFSWGYNGRGTLFNGTKEHSLYPKKIQDNVKDVFIDSRWEDYNIISVLNDNTLLVPEGSDEENGWGDSLIKGFESKGDIVKFIAHAQGYIVLYSNGELWQEDKKMLASNIKDINSLLLINQNNELLYLDRETAEIKEVAENIVSFSGNYLIDTNGDVFAFSFMDETVEIQPYSRVKNALKIFSKHYIDKDTGYLYAWGTTEGNKLGIELNPNEEIIEVPVQVIFPKGA